MDNFERPNYTHHTNSMDPSRHYRDKKLVYSGSPVNIVLPDLSHSSQASSGQLTLLSLPVRYDKNILLLFHAIMIQIRCP